MSNEAVRAEFLNRHWRRYPRFSLQDFPAERWAWGRIENLTEFSLTLRHSKMQWQRLAAGPVSLQAPPAPEAAVLGPPIPWVALKKGDYVTFLREFPEVMYLLSPSMMDYPLVIDPQWPLFLEAVADYFKQQGFAQWPTPYLVTSSGVDAHIDFFKVQGVRTQKTFALPTSPELELKKAIAAGAERVFEIKSCFRDDDKTPIHRSEFTMLEWYRSYEDKWALLDDIHGLIAHLQPILHHEFDDAANAHDMEDHDDLPATSEVNEEFLEKTLSKAIPRRSISELFREYVGMDLTPRTAKGELAGALSRLGLDQSPTDDWDDLFFRLYIEKIEPHLGEQGLEAIYNFPATQGSLSRTTDDGWADRFEVYCKGVELANAYQEQNDPYLVEIRVRSEVRKRKTLGRVAHEIDEEFLKIMRSGFPPCAGIALGLDRLYMVLKNRKSI